MLASVSYKPITLFELGPFTLSLHGLFAGLGFLAGSYLMIRRARLRGLDENKIISVLTWALIGAILGARLFTVPAHLGDPGFGIVDVVSPAGYFSIMGGFAGGIIAAVVRFRMLDLYPLAYLDLASFGLALGTVVGRIGDLLIVEHLGGTTDFFLGFLVKPGYDLAPQHDPLEVLCETQAVCGPYHHAGLYDLLGAALLLGVLYLVSSRARGLRYGMLFVLWAGWYGFQRFFIDFTRNTDLANADATLGPLTWNQWSGLSIGLIAIATLIWMARGGTRRVTEEHDIEYGAVPAGTAPVAGE